MLDTTRAVNHFRRKRGGMRRAKIASVCLSGTPQSPSVPAVHASRYRGHRTRQYRPSSCSGRADTHAVIASLPGAVGHRHVNSEGAAGIPGMGDGVPVREIKVKSEWDGPKPAFHSRQRRFTLQEALERANPRRPGGVASEPTIVEGVRKLTTSSPIRAGPALERTLNEIDVRGTTGHTPGDPPYPAAPPSGLQSCRSTGGRRGGRLNTVDVKAPISTHHPSREA